MSWYPNLPASMTTTPEHAEKPNVGRNVVIHSPGDHRSAEKRSSASCSARIDVAVRPILITASEASAPADQLSLVRTAPAYYGRKHKYNRLQFHAKPEFPQALVRAVVTSRPRAHAQYLFVVMAAPPKS